MPYVRKTRDRWDIETNYGYGWETECSSYDYNDARDTLYDYRANACGRFSTRLVKRREYLKAKEPPAITRADRIRSMTDEQLADLWLEYMDCEECPMRKTCESAQRSCKSCIVFALDWLRKEVKTDA